MLYSLKNYYEKESYDLLLFKLFLLKQYNNCFKVYSDYLDLKWFIINK